MYVNAYISFSPIWYLVLDNAFQCFTPLKPKGVVQNPNIIEEGKKYKFEL